jgi:16S rRNA (cytosine1402-N4)-methyltransferase
LPSSPAESGHTTVLLDEAITALALREGGRYVDGTFGGGGHSRAILNAEPPVGMLVAFDADAAAIDRANRLRDEIPDPDRLRFVHANFTEMRDRLTALGIDRVEGLLLDLGLSSFQLDQPERGFAFRFDDAPLDMRFDRSRGITAADIVASLPADELAVLLRRYGEEPQAKRIAQAIVRDRAKQPVATAQDLVRIVTSVTGPPRRTGIHPATRTFQALRIAVNQELESLSTMLGMSGDILAPGGRLVVLSFHSLEDRLVKRFLETASSYCICPPEQPICTCDHLATFRRVGKPVRASDQEQARNPRSRSVIMRTGERISLDESLALKRTLRTRD